MDQESGFTISTADLWGMLSGPDKDGFYIRGGCGYDPRLCEMDGTKRPDSLNSRRILCNLTALTGFAKCGKANQR